MTRPTTRQDDPNVLAVLHRAGTVWRGVIVRRDAASRGDEAALTLLASREFSSGLAGGLESWLDQHAAGEVICVLPASVVICRTCSLPDVPLEQLQPALRLQAEAHLFGIAPPHRLGMAVLHQAPGETSRSGMILAWPESAAFEPPPTKRPMSFTPDVAAIAALLDGHRPAEPVIWMDRSDGSVALAVTHSNGAIFRDLREDAEDDSDWENGIGRVLAETCLNVGHSPEFIDAAVTGARGQAARLGRGQGSLLIPPGLLDAVAANVTGVTDDATWWSQYGVALGAALCRTGPLAPLSRLRAEAQADRPSPLRNIVTRLTQPATARVLVAAAIVLLVFGPMIANGARLGLLKWRHADLDRQLILVNETRNRLAVYRELERNTWPMTKILADLACNTPEGIELEEIRVLSSRNFQLRGTALPHGGRSAQEVFVLMQEYLRESGIFAGVSLNWGDSNAYGHYQFDLSGSLLRPYHRHEYPDELDFGKYTVIDRRDGRGPGAARVDVEQDEIARSGEALEPYEPVDPERHATADWYDRGAEEYDEREARAPARQAGRPRDPAGGRSRPLDDEAGTRRDAVGSGGVPASMDIPEPLTEDAVRVMSEAEVLQAMARYGQARQSAASRGDAELADRLRNDWNLLVKKRRGDL